MRIADLIYFFLRKAGLGFILLRWHKKSALRQCGWYRSFAEKRSINANGDIIPWWTYSFNDFIVERITKNMRVLEYGSGSSTLWLASNAGDVVSIENDPVWYDKISMRLPDNARIILTAEMDSYIPKQNEHGLFDILIIDALGSRISHAKNSINILSDDGVVIWDNTDGTDWNEIKSIMAEFGFKEISFHGMTAQEFAQSKTTVFYRSANCLGI